MKKLIQKIIKPKLKLAKGTRLLSLGFIAVSMIVAAGVLLAANVYYNLDTSEVVTEEIQRVTQLIRATGGLIAGGASTDTLSADISLQVSGGKLVVGTTTSFRVATSGEMYVGGTSTFATTSSFEGALQFTGGNADIGFKAPSNAGTTTAKYYVLPQHGTTPPSDNYVLTWQSGDQLTWKSLSGAGSGGDITYVGDVETGDAFTADGGGNSLWFEGPTADEYEVILTATDATGSDKTITLPNLTGTAALSSGGLGSSAVLFSSSGLIATSSNFQWDSDNNRLGIGTTSPDYALDVIGAIRGSSLRIYGAGAGEVIFTAPNMGSDTSYTWPSNDGDSNNVLTSNGSGGLSWSSVSGVGGVTGTGSSGRLVKWTGASTVSTSSISDSYSGIALTIGSTGTSTFATSVVVLGTLDPNYVAGYTLIGNIVGSGSPSITGIGGISAATATLSTWVKAPTFTSSGTTTISSDDSKGIVLDPASGKIKIASGDYIETDGGYEIGKSGTQVLKEMIPILGFDFPVRCSTACQTATSISRIIEDYPFSSVVAGATRVHKFVIRYADSTTTASSTWTVYNDTDSATTSSFTVPPSASTDLGKGEAYITGAVTIPTDTDDWMLKMQVPSGTTIQVYEIYLASYDQVD